MCVVDGSPSQATSTCPMCKFYAPSAARCPHKREVCHNYSAHPGLDIQYMKNAEVSTFNGCGYCKWAAKNPHLPGTRNVGWPGCCRAPGAAETKLVPAADWPAVSGVHHIPMPPEIKALLDKVVPLKSIPLHSQSVNTPRAATVQPPPTMERKNSGPTGTTVKATVVPVRTAPVGIPPKARSTGSPKAPASSLTGSISRSTASHLSSSPGTGVSQLEQRENLRQTEKRQNSSPGSKAKELDGSVGRRGSTRRPSVSVALQTPTMAKPLLPPDEHSQPTLRRRASTANASGAVNKSLSPSTKSSEISANTASVSRRPQNRRASLSEVFTDLKVTKKQPNSASSESGGSAGSGSLSESTVTSEGFTDYLSDESEAEIQRQAELKAAQIAQIAQNQMEELEFKAARMQLANVDLRPPKSWNPGSTTSRS